MPLLYKPSGRAPRGNLLQRQRQSPTAAFKFFVSTGQPPPRFAACYASSTRSSSPSSVGTPDSHEAGPPSSGAGPATALSSSAASTSTAAESGSPDEVLVRPLNSGASSTGSPSSSGLRPASEFKGAIRVQPTDFEEVCVFEESPDGSVTINCMPLSSAATASVSGSLQGTVGDMLNSKAHSADGATPANGSSIVTSALSSSLLQQEQHAAPASSSSGDDYSSASGRGSAAMSMTSTVDEEFQRIHRDPSRASIDQADTPEGLADVEATSVAPVADWIKNKVREVRICACTAWRHAAMEASMRAAAVRGGGGGLLVLLEWRS